MKNIRITATDFNLKLAQIDQNYSSIKEKIDELAKENNIICFPELSLTGCTLKNLLSNKSVLKKSIYYLRKLIEFSKDYNLLFTVGLPIEVDYKIYSAIAVISKGRNHGFYLRENVDSKESRYLHPYQKDFFSIQIGEDTYEILNDMLLSFEGINLAVTVSKDDETTIPKSLFYKTLGANIILNPNNRIYFVDTKKEVENQISYLSKDIVYVTSSFATGESSTDFAYLGVNAVAKDGHILNISSNTTSCEVILVSNINNTDQRIDIDFFKEYPIIYYPKFPYLPCENMTEEFVNDILDIQSKALYQRLQSIGINKVILGLSGGLDSTMALMALFHTFKKYSIDTANILIYTMPAFATSNITKSNAYKLCEALDLKLNEIDISEIVKKHLFDIGHNMHETDATYENAQARERTQVLMDIANMKKAIVIGTGDLSELALGFATYNGDQMSMYSLNGSLTKTHIRLILNHLALKTDNYKLREVLNSILDTPISPELVKESSDKITQKTEEIVGPYELIDFFIYHVLKYSADKRDILKLATSAFKDKYDKSTIEKWLISFYNRFCKSQFKRSCMPDGCAISEINFSPREGYLMPSDVSWEIFND